MCSSHRSHKVIQWKSSAHGGAKDTTLWTELRNPEVVNEVFRDLDLVRLELALLLDRLLLAPEAPLDWARGALRVSQ